MSTDRHLDDNADDQVRAPRRRDIAELEQLQRDAGPTPVAIRSRHLESAIAGHQAGRDLRQYETLTDLVGHAPDASPALTDEMDRRDQVIRTVAEDIPAGATLEVRADGRVYALDETAGELAEQLVDVAESAAAIDQVQEAAEQPHVSIELAAPYDFAEAIAGMANSHLQAAGIALEVVEACTGCGCTDARACLGGGCYWIQGADEPPRCSECGPADGSPTPPRPTTWRTTRAGSCPGCGKAISEHPPGPPCPPPAPPGRSHG